MKTLIFLVSLVLGTVSASASTKHKAAKLASKAKTTTEAASKSGLSTDVRFGDQSVGGKYQLPMEALSVVENEKSIDDLIGVRKNFQDRIMRTKGMR